MLKTIKKFTLFIVTFLLVFSSSIVVYAGGNFENLNDTQKENARNLYAYLKLAGYSDYAAAGICGNADQESSFNPAITGSHNGAFQMSSGQWTNLQTWASENNLDYKDIVTQFKFIEGTRLESDFKETTTITLGDYKSCSDIITGTEGFMVAYERCVNGSYSLQKITLKSGYGPYRYQEGKQRADYAENLYTALVGTPPADTPSSVGTLSSAQEKTQDEVKQELMAKGYYSEDQLSSYIKLNEINIEQKYLDAALRENLDQASLSGLSNWERNIKNNAKEDGFIAILRIIVMWIGIMFNIWIILIYIAYWFDRLNTIFYIDMLSLLTFGKLHISDTEDECTFTVKTLGKTEKKTVNHKAILSICITGLIFSTLILTGTFYRLIAGFVNFILSLIN